MTRLICALAPIQRNARDRRRYYAREKQAVERGKIACEKNRNLRIIEREKELRGFAALLAAFQLETGGGGFVL